MEQIKYGKKCVEYSVKRGKRKKTIAITITPTAQVIVLTPYSITKGDISRIVKKKARWILEKQEFFGILAALFPEKEFVSGEQILYLGRKYRLKVVQVSRDCSSIPELMGRRMFVLVNQYLNSREKKKIIKDAIVKWYFAKSEKIIKQRVNRYSKFIGVNPQEIKIKDQKKRWGSCSISGVLRFNWRVAIAPMSIIDYIIVHELSHLKIKNHSKEFWRLVSLVLPDYQKRRDWLKNNAGIFRI
jgi:predicted metal-dependent hydrolase